MTPLAIDQWGWSKADAIVYLGITMASGGVLSGICFATIGPLSKKLDERVILILFGIVPMILGRICMFPMGSQFPEPVDDVTKPVNVTLKGNLDDERGRRPSKPCEFTYIFLYFEVCLSR